ncbi:MAG: glycogen synthase GlgA [Saccharofermentanaceae bacterium]|jgi:starch synthase|nr:glycogen synthase GlgA [Saccharofermentanaceae bacterium]
MNKVKVLFVSSEVYPFAKVGGLADVVGALPVELQHHHCDARVIMPLYKSIKQKHEHNLDFIGWKMIKMGWRSLYAGLYTLTMNGVQFYFVDNEYYFNFDQVYVEYVFDIERFCFFQRAVLDFLGDFMRFEPDVLHCNDWQAGMMPLLLDAHYKKYGYHTNIKTVFTIHNLKYQGIHGIEVIQDLLDLPSEYLTDELSIKDGAVNFMKAGIVYSNSVTTVSPTYAYEIMTDYYGEGLNHTLQRYAYKVSGILNGINAEEYNPSKDTMIPQKYSIKNYEEGKAVNKKSIQEQLGLEVNPGAPLCSMISRLVDQKGLDLLLRVVEEMLYDGMQIVILGTGDAYYERSLADIAARNPGKMCACISFDNGLAHTLYAGSDIFLMPSLFEPCGLSQLIAMTYGTIPIVRETGGLRDTVVPYNEFTGEGNGFSFANINAHEFLFVTKYACDLYRHNKPVWNKLIEEGMKADYSWKKSAEEYAGLYSFITGISIADDEEPEKKPLTEEILDIGKEKKEEAPKKVKKTTAKKPEVKKTTTKAASSEKKSTASKSASKTSKTSSASAKKTTKAASEKSESKASSSKETKKS